MEEIVFQANAGVSGEGHYPKFAGTTRMLVLETEYFFDKSWMRAGKELGWECMSIPPFTVGEMTQSQLDALLRTLVGFRPDFVLASNYAGMDEAGLFAKVLEHGRIPYVSWFTDTPRMILHGREVHRSYYCVAATWERSYTGHLKELGFDKVMFMPLATDPYIFNAEPAQTFERQLAFVGRSMADLAAGAWKSLEEVPDLADNIRATFDLGRVTREEFAKGIKAILGSACLQGRTPDQLRNAELCLNYEATRRQRAAIAKRLEPLGLEVRGDPYWRNVVGKAEGDVAYFDELAHFYRGTAVNINSTSLQMNSAVNQRVFDCPAAGGFLITDAQEDIEDLFDPDTEVVTYRSLDELESKVRHFLRHPEERTSIVRRARRRVLAKHTHRHRLKTLVAFLKEHYAG